MAKKSNSWIPKLSLKLTEHGPSARVNIGPIQATKGPGGSSVMYKAGGTKVQHYTPPKPK